MNINRAAIYPSLLFILSSNQEENISFYTQQNRETNEEAKLLKDKKASFLNFLKFKKKIKTNLKIFKKANLFKSKRVENDTK